MKTIAIESTEETEFLALVGEHSKWGQRLKGAQSFMAASITVNPAMSRVIWMTGVNDPWHAPLPLDYTD